MEPARFGFLLPGQSMFPEVVGVNIEALSGFVMHFGNVLTTVVLKPGSAKSNEFIASTDYFWPVIYQRFAHARQVAIEDDYVAQLRTTEVVSELRRRIEGFELLGANWDGEGAVAISSETVKTSLRALENIAIVLERKNTLSAPSVRPFPDGSIFFKWIRGQKELAITVQGRDVEAQHWEPLDSFRSQGLWEISVDETAEHAEWVLT